MEQKLAEERAAKLRLENRILELEKHSSMMDCDYKQALQKLDELRRHKDRLTEEVSVYVRYRRPVKCVYILNATYRNNFCGLFNSLSVLSCKGITVEKMCTPTLHFCIHLHLIHSFR